MIATGRNISRQRPFDAIRQHSFLVFPVIVLMLLINYNLAAQPDFTKSAQNSKYILSLKSDLQINANTLDNTFISDFYYGRFLSASVKTDQLHKLRNEKNSFGYLFRNELCLYIPADKESWGFYTAFAMHNIMQLQFGKNLFRLAFFGNGDLAGQSVSLDKTELNMLNFQQFKIGIVKKWNKGFFGTAISIPKFETSGLGQRPEKSSFLTLGLAINKGQSLLSLNVPEAAFFTHSNAEYLELGMLINMQRSDTLSSGFGAMNGAGISADLAYTYLDEKNIFSCSITDFGFISWNRYSQQYSMDTLIHFEGIDIPNLFDYDQEINGESADSILNRFAYARSESNFTTMIPMYFDIYYSRLLCKNYLSLTAKVSHVFFLNYRPLISFTPTVNIPIGSCSLHIAPSLIHGGFGGFNAGLSIAANIKKSFYIEIRSDYINSYINYNNSAGAGGFISLIKTF